MLPRQNPTENMLGRDVSDRILPNVDGGRSWTLMSAHETIWDRAKPYLAVRDNDVHTLYAYGIGRALLAAYPDADPDVVLPAILLHDTGWSQVPEDDVLAAIAPGAGRPDLVLLHEKEGARIARQILAEVGWDTERCEQVIAIVDGHDSRPAAINLNDALMKDADKLWRLTPHGVETVMNWFGLTREQAHRLIGSRVHSYLLTDVGRGYGCLLASLVSMDTAPARIELG